jgi:phosphoglycolate phosphatase-like HAD superfamily hydrolase
MSARTLTAVVWDFDGTLVDSRRRNYNVVRRIMAEVAQRPLDSFPALRDWHVYDQVNRSYANWRDLYAREFGFSEEETDRVGRMWTPAIKWKTTPSRRSSTASPRCSRRWRLCRTASCP